MCLSFRERHITGTEYWKGMTSNMIKFAICILVTAVMFSSCASESKSGFFDDTTNNDNTDSEDSFTDTSVYISDILIPPHDIIDNNIGISESEKELCREAADRAHLSVFSNFKADDIIPIDNVILYYELFMMRGEKGALLPELEQYKTNNNFFEIRIPKEKIRNDLQPLFSPYIDDTYSKYEDPTDNNYIILDAEVRGHIFSRCKSYTKKDDIIEMEVEGGWIDPVPESGDGYNVAIKFILGVKLLGESEFMYMYCNSIEDIPQGN